MQSPGSWDCLFSLLALNRGRAGHADNSLRRGAERTSCLATPPPSHVREDPGSKIPCWPSWESRPELLYTRKGEFPGSAICFPTMFNVYGKQNIHLIFNVYGTKVIGIVKALLGLKQGVKISSIQQLKRNGVRIFFRLCLWV